MGNTAVRRPALGPALHPSPGSLSEDPVTVQGANTHTGSTRELSSGQCGPQNPRRSAGSELLRALHGACRAPLPTSAPSCRPSWTRCWPLAGVRRRHRQHWQTVSFPPHTCGKKRQVHWKVCSMKQCKLLDSGMLLFLIRCVMEQGEARSVPVDAGQQPLANSPGAVV